MPKKKSDEPVFEPRSQGIIPFGGKEIIKAQLEDDRGYVVIRSLAEAFGIGYTTMYMRLQRDPYWKPYTAMIKITGKGGPQPALCLMAATVPLFLGGTETTRLAEEDRERLEIFLDECMDVLAEHFGISERDEMRMMRLQLVQLETERRVKREIRASGQTLSVEEELKKVRAEMAEIQKAHEEKVAQIRKAFVDLRDSIKNYNQAAGDECITEEQQGEVYLAVELLGNLLEQRGQVKPYAAIYMDLSRISGRASYKQIPKSKYKAVMDHLNKRIEAVTRMNGDGEPSI